ncbi:MAG: HlyD family efflux transporter periplasmic adaptor subunit [Magnetococcales bacterium]|nr:HlyD family efflux transporter periplasmic adaptor subunit [Magnetococcales bacterium]
MTAPSQPLDTILGGLLNLQNRLCSATTREGFHFTVVNEIFYLVNYRQAVLWRAGASRGKGRVEALSGVPLLDRDVPFAQWCARLMTHLETLDLRQPALLKPEELPAPFPKTWAEWLPEHALWLPVALPGEAPLLGGVLFARETPWSEGEILMLTQLGLTMAPVWWGLHARRAPWQRLREKGARKSRLLLLLGLLGLSLLPVRQSVLAPAEVTPLNPVVVRAPIDGVVERFHVTPNQGVVAGQPLLSLDAKKLDNRLIVTRNELDVARAEYRQAVQTALRNPRDSTRIALLKGRVEQKTADLEFIRQQLEQVKIVASRDGVAVFSDENDWLGRPVTLGERIMMLADPTRVELEIHLPIADAISLAPGAPVALYPAASPGQPLHAKLRYSSYRADIQPDGVLAYRLKADFSADTSLPGLGLRGFARIYGAEVTLFHYLARRPLAMGRRMVGL